LKTHYSWYQQQLQRFNKTATATPVIREVYVAETTQQAEDEARDGIMYIHGGIVWQMGKRAALRDDQGVWLKTQLL